MKFTRNYKLSLILLAVYLVVAATGSSRCPSPCRCNATTVSCAERELVDIPTFDNLRPKIIDMDLSRNDIDTISEDAFTFSGVAQIKQLRINENSITDIEPNCFVKLIDLELLDLHDNLIGSLPMDIVKYNRKLKTLDLSHNLFTRATPIIESDSLVALDLSYTRISTFAEENILHLPNLRILHLYHNNLNRVSPEIFLKSTNLLYVELASNVWNCDCATIKLFDSLLQQNLTTIDTVQCKAVQHDYIDIYNANGPIYSNETCDPRTNATVENANGNGEATPEFYQNRCDGFFCNSINYTIVVAVSVISILVLVGIVLMLVLFKVRRYEKVEVSYEMKTTTC